MSLELGLCIIIFVGMIMNDCIIYLFDAGQDERIKQLDDHQQWQDNERERLRERVVTVEKRLEDMLFMFREFKKEVISTRRKMNDFLLKQRLEREAANATPDEPIEQVVEPENVLEPFCSEEADEI